MFALKEAEDRLRKTEYAKENLARDLERQTNKVQMIEKNQELVSSLLVQCDDTLIDARPNR
jgi:hypothetical protein